MSVNAQECAQPVQDRSQDWFEVVRVQFQTDGAADTNDQPQPSEQKLPLACCANRFAHGCTMQR